MARATLGTILRIWNPSAWTVWITLWTLRAALAATPSKLNGLDLLPAAGDITRCQWTERTKDSVRRLRATCRINRAGSAVYSRQLCVDQPLSSRDWATVTETPLTTDPPPAAGQFVTRLGLDGTTNYGVVFDITPTATGVYWVNTTEIEGQRPRTFGYFVRPRVTIRVTRPPRRDQPDRIVCEAEGEYGRGVMTLTGCGGEILHRTAFVRPGLYSNGSVEAVLERDGGVTRWIYQIWGGLHRQEYRCQLTPYGCDDLVTGFSPRVILNSEAVNVTYVRAADTTPAGQVPQIWTVCCQAVVSRPTRVAWRYGAPCESVQELGFFEPDRDPPEGRIPVGGETDDISLHYTVAGSASGPSFLRLLQTCLRSDEPSLDLPSGNYECVVNTERATLYQTAFQLQGNLDARLTVTSEGVTVGCLVRDVASGLLEVERLDDGQVLMTYPLDVQRHHRQNGHDGPVSWRQENGTSWGTLFEVRFPRPELRDAGFRCRITDGCQVRASPPLTRWTEELRRAGSSTACSRSDSPAPTAKPAIPPPEPAKPNPPHPVATDASSPHHPPRSPDAEDQEVYYLLFLIGSVIVVGLVLHICRMYRRPRSVPFAPWLAPASS